MKKSEVLSLLEKVELGLVEKGLDFEEMTKLYHDSGGDKRYHDWMEVHGNQLVKQWIEERAEQGLSLSSDEATVDGIVYCMSAYIEWLKTLN